MKENVLDVLMYLFENYLEDDNVYQTDRDTLKVELEEAGFADREVSRAFTWLEALACNAGDASRPIHTHTAMRIFHPAGRKGLSYTKTFRILSNRYSIFALKKNRRIIKQNSLR